VFATAITLILVPNLYRIVEDLKGLLGVKVAEQRVTRQTPTEDLA
jgi:hypothetical protein